MPVIRSAIKKVRQDKRRFERNSLVRRHYKQAVKAFKEKTSKELLRQVYSAVDVAVKKKVVHQNLAARLKSRLAKDFNQVKQKKQKNGR